MRRPSFQFYPADWSGNTNLRRCSHQEKGVWMDVMCLMHDSEEYGVLRWPLVEIAKAISCNSAILRKLTERNVLKGVDAGHCEPYIYVPRSGGVNGSPVTLIQCQAGPIWYSSRMVRDEYVRQHRGQASRFIKQDGADDRSLMWQPKDLPKPPFGDGSTSSVSTTSTSTVTIAARAGAPLSGHKHCSQNLEANFAVSDRHADLRASVQAVLEQMQSAGVQDVDPFNKRLIALVAASSDPAEFYYAADKAVGLGKGFSYALGVVEGWRRDAAAYVSQSSSGPGLGSKSVEMKEDRP